MRVKQFKEKLFVKRTKLLVEICKATSLKETAEQQRIKRSLRKCFKLLENKSLKKFN